MVSFIDDHLDKYGVEPIGSMLADYYRRVYERKLGAYASLLFPAERTSELEVS